MGPAGHRRLRTVQSGWPTARRRRRRGGLRGAWAVNRSGRVDTCRMATDRASYTSSVAPGCRIGVRESPEQLGDLPESNPNQSVRTIRLRRMSEQNESQAPQRGDVILRATGDHFELIDAVSDAVLANGIPSIAQAIEEARSRNANEIWQQRLDARGLPKGEPFGLPRK